VGDKINQFSLPQGVWQQLSMDILKFMPTSPRGWGGGVTIDKCIIYSKIFQSGIVFLL
jgi:hypothetical protein